MREGRKGPRPGQEGPLDIPYDASIIYNMMALDENRPGVVGFMPYYSEDSLLIVGNSRTTSDNPITLQYSQFFLSLVVDPSTGEIADCGASVTVEATNRFIRDLFVGRRMIRDDALIVAQVQDRYHGSSQKAIVAAYRDAVKKFREITGQ